MIKHRRKATTWITRLTLVAAAGILALLVDSNVSWRRSTQTLAERLDRSIRLGTDWMVANPERSNPVLLYMVQDMATLSGDERLRRVVANAQADPALRNSIWHRMLDPAADVRRTRRQEFDGLDDYVRWFAYAIAPQEVELTEGERRAMLAPDEFAWGSRTHQLFAVILYRSRIGDSPAVTNLVNHLCEQIAIEEHWDVRVTDLYLQRMAFILAAGRPDLIKRRWVERAIEAQYDGGGWVSSWYGWGPGLFAFSLRPKIPNSHTTVQGVWILYMLKYRFPDWLR